MRAAVFQYKPFMAIANMVGLREWVGDRGLYHLIRKLVKRIFGVTFYLSSPGSQMHASAANGMPVLLSFTTHSRWVDDYVPSFSRLLIDSGAFSELRSGVKVDGSEYREWQARWRECEHLDAVAGLDDIRGDWRKSLRNYELYGGFPTMHETDPPELLADLVPIARERGGWLGIGLLPPRSGKWRWVRETLSRIPDGLHVHFWAGGEYLSHPRVDSVDSTNAWLDVFALRQQRLTGHLTPAECCEIVVKRYQRFKRVVRPALADATATLFDGVDDSENCVAARE